MTTQYHLTLAQIFFVGPNGERQVFVENMEPDTEVTCAHFVVTKTRNVWTRLLLQLYICAWKTSSKQCRYTSCSDIGHVQCESRLTPARILHGRALVGGPENVCGPSVWVPRSVHWPGGGILSNQPLQESYLHWWWRGLSLCAELMYVSIIYVSSVDKLGLYFA